MPLLILYTPVPRVSPHTAPSPTQSKLLVLEALPLFLLRSKCLVFSHPHRRRRLATWLRSLAARASAPSSFLLPMKTQTAPFTLFAPYVPCAMACSTLGKDTVDLDSFASFLTQPDTVDVGPDGQTVDSSALFLDSWLFTHQIPLWQAEFRRCSSAHFSQASPCEPFLVTPDLFHWQGHLLDGIQVTLNFGVECLELASEHFIYARFPYPQPGLSPPLLEHNGWTLTPDCGSYFFSLLPLVWVTSILLGPSPSSQPPSVADRLAGYPKPGCPSPHAWQPASSSQIPACCPHPFFPHGAGPALPLQHLARSKFESCRLVGCFCCPYWY